MAKPKDLELLQAAKLNDTGAVRKLLAKIKTAKSKKGSKLKYNINLQDEDGFTALHHSALKGNTEIALSLFDMDCSVNAKDNKGMSPLHLAAWAGQVEVARLMVDKGAEVNMRSSTGDTPLHLACQHGNIEVAEVLIDGHADPTILNRNGSAGLDLSCQFGHGQIIQYLLLSEATIKLLNLSDSPRTSDPPLHLAAKTGHTDIVRMLVEAGAPINQMGKNGTCLHEAALYGKTEVVKLLLDMKADVDARNSEGHTALDVVHLFTSSKASIEIKLLLKGASESRTIFARATVDFRNIYDPTCLSFKAGDTIMVLEQHESGMWKGKIHDGQRERVGYFPSTAVKVSASKKVRTTSVKEAGVVPRGTYDMVTLPSGASSSSPPPNKDSPPMSSFGPGKKLPATLLPIQDKAELLNRLGNLHKTPPPSKKPHIESSSPYTKQNGTSFKPQPTLNYTQVVVGKKSASPPPLQGQIFGKTQYAEVVLPSSPTETDVGAGVPSLPPKESRNEDAASGGDIWVKNKEKIPLLPPKKGKETTKAERSPSFEAPPNFKPPPVPVKMEHPKLTIEKAVKSSPEQGSKTAANVAVKIGPAKPEIPDPCEGPPTFKPPPVPVKMDQTRLTVEKPAKPPTPVGTPVGTPEQMRKMKAKEGYEDMSFTAEPSSAPGTPTKEGKTPQKEDKYTRESVNIRDSLTNRQQRLATYENVELKKKPKAVKELSMLITELDRKEYGAGTEEYVLVNRSNTNTGPLGYEDVHVHRPHSYENVARPESSSRERHNTPPGGLGGTPSQEESRDYENMETQATTDIAGKRSVQAYEHMEDVSGKQDGQEEPVSPRSTVYTSMKRAQSVGQSANDYINIKQGLTNEANPNIGPGTTQITQLKMREYNAMYDWLESFKLNVYIDNFVKGGFDMTSMKGLTGEDLTAISVTKTGHRKKLLVESAKLPSLTDEFPKNKPADIMTWLKLIGLDQYIPNFLDGGFDDMEFVLDLTVEDLETIEIKKPGHRRKLWMSSNTLKDEDDGNDSGFETNRESSHVQETSLNGNVKPFLETDLDALTMQVGEKLNIDTAPAESAPQEIDQENVETNPLPNTDNETKIADASEQELEVSTRLVEENEPDLDSMLGLVGDESTEYENVAFPQSDKSSEVDSEKETIMKDEIEQATAVSSHPESPDSTQEPLADHVPPVCGSHVQPGLPQPSDHVEQTMSELSVHMAPTLPDLPVHVQLSESEPPVHVQPSAGEPSVHVQTDAAEAQTFKKPAPPPVHPKPRSRTGSREKLDQINAPTELHKDKSPSPPVKPKLRVEPPRAKENVKEITGTFVPTLSGGDFTSPPPVRPKSFKRDPPHIPPKPLNSDPFPRASSLSYHGKPQDHVSDAARRRSGSEKLRKTPPPPPPRRSSDKNLGSRSNSSSSSSSVEMFLEEMEIKRRSLENLSPHPQRKSSASANLQSPSHTTAVNDGSEGKQVFEEIGLDKQITEILRRKSRDELSIPELPDSPSLVAEEQDVNGNEDAFSVEPEKPKPEEKVTGPKDTLIEDINNMLSDFTSELDNMFN